ncbi:MAG: cellulase family glycosylhydrolase [Opitutaceae bacterium]|jgi:hypothetical protein|nr:cellulase family glycosylhydrolase [Opitutaceae bacterium]
MKSNITKNIALRALAIIALAFAGIGTATADIPRWSAARAWGWYKARPWPVGFNYVAGYAVNQIDMWQSSTFNPVYIDREFACSDQLGFNTVRIFLSDFVYKNEPETFKKNLGAFLDIAQKHGLRVIVTFFTNGGKETQPWPPNMGRQPEPVTGSHGGTWQQSPGAEIVNDPSRWAPLETYVKDIINTFKDDHRVLLWCLYNEPQNTRRGADSTGLLRAVFRWAREINPSQPLSSPVWGLPSRDTRLDIVTFALENSDVITFHDYKIPPDTYDFIKSLQRLNRPLICQEYMARPRGSTFRETMPLLKVMNVGAINWGLVNNQMNYQYPWDAKDGDPEPKVWFHDIFRKDGTPHDPEEIALIREMTGKTPVVPAERWTEKRAWDWYNARPWPVGCNLVPAYAVNSIDLWQRSTFNPAEIDRELGLAEGLGFNTIRIFLNDVVYQNEPVTLKRNIRTFLDLCEKHRQTAIPTFFTNGGGDKQPPAAKMGRQPPHWFQSPGAKIVNDPAQWGRLEVYVKDILRTFKNDRRVMMWCLYNEPQNTLLGAESAGLLRAVFRWAREINPSQPLTAPIWGLPARTNQLDIVGFVLENSDVITFHDYKIPKDTADLIKTLRHYNRPMVCTEYMGRPRSTFQGALPLFKKERIGAMSWGLVARSDKSAHPGQKPEEIAAGIWYHNIFHRDGTPYDPEEITFIKKTTGKSGE